MFPQGTPGRDEHPSAEKLQRFYDTIVLEIQEREAQRWQEEFDQQAQGMGGFSQPQRDVGWGF